MSWSRMRRPNPASKPPMFLRSTYGPAEPDENEESNERKLADDAAGAHPHRGHIGSPGFPGSTGDVHAEEAAIQPSRYTHRTENGGHEESSSFTLASGADSESGTGTFTGERPCRFRDMPY